MKIQLKNQRKKIQLINVNDLLIEFTTNGGNSER